MILSRGTTLPIIDNHAMPKSDQEAMKNKAEARKSTAENTTIVRAIGALAFTQRWVKAMAHESMKLYQLSKAYSDKKDVRNQITYSIQADD